jgi:phosphatidate cytidylyltransferase
MTQPHGGRWNDLQTRVISAAVMLAVGAVDIWLGGVPFTALVVVLTGLMIWELATITAPTTPQTAIIMALIAAAVLAATQLVIWHSSAALLIIPPIALALTPRRDLLITAAYAAVILAAGYGLISLRNTAGTPAILWLIGVVIMSDIMGYFAGRSLGGPKFWPAISPKKTWSGTVAGWAGAALVGLGFVVFAGAGWGLIILSSVISFAGQMGDIAESWIKRRTGIKDSSALIPGHGGVLDRFDALIGAVVALMLLGLILPLPLPMGH